MNDIKMYVTDKGSKKYWQEQPVQVKPQDDFVHVIKIYPELQEQVMEGFGGAFTEAAAVCFDGLSTEVTAVNFGGSTPLVTQL